MRIQEYKNFPVSNLDEGLHQNLTAGTLVFIPVSYIASLVNSDTVYPWSFEWLYIYLNFTHMFWLVLVNSTHAELSERKFN